MNELPDHIWDKINRATELLKAGKEHEIPEEWKGEVTAALRTALKNKIIKLKMELNVLKADSKKNIN